MQTKLITALCLISAMTMSAQDQVSNTPQNVPLTIPVGVPLRLYLTKRVSKRSNAPVEARLLTALYAFDREVIPAGTRVIGHVGRVYPVSKWERTRAVLGGDFTPLHVAPFEFTSLQLPDGSTLPLHTVGSPGLGSLVPLIPQKAQQLAASNSSGGLVAKGKQKARDQITSQMAFVKSIPAIVRAPGKKEWLYDFLMSKLPYHPQYVRSRTRVDAELIDPLNFGSATMTQDSLKSLGSQPAADSIAHVRLLTPLDSASSQPGQKIEALLEQPLFSADHKLVLPEGTRLVGSVVVAHRARWFHRGGRLRFSFREVNLPEQMTQLKLNSTADSPSQTREDPLQFRTRGSVKAVESDKAPLKVDEEGGVQPKESKTRFLGPAVALLVASRAADNDPIRGPNGAITGHSSNIGGRTLGGGMGFGLIGTIAAQTSHLASTALGYYGLAWSVYSTLIARGTEVQFGKNAVLDISFNARTVALPTKSKAAGVSGSGQ